MKLGTLREGGRDGTLVVVNRELTQVLPVPHIARTLQAALDDWAETEPRLRAEYDALNAGKHENAQPYNVDLMHSPLPRAYQWVDGSAYLYHVELVRKARGAEMPPSFLHDPLMYQGCSDSFLAPTAPIALADEMWGIDLEAEVAVITGDVPMGSTPAQAESHVRLIMLVNDVSLRNLIPGELAKGFGFFHSKPASSFSPVAVTPDELGVAWHDARVNLPLRSSINGEWFGHPNAGVDMQFGFGELVAHAAYTRHLCAGTIVGSGTVSNRTQGVGSSCLAEKRMVEIIAEGKPLTAFLGFGDTVKIEMLDAEGRSIFGAIEQTVLPYLPPVGE